MKTLNDGYKLSIKIRIRLAFLMYASISLGASLYVWMVNSEAADLDWAYRIGFPIAVISCLYMVIKPTIGEGSLFLAPLFIMSLVRVLDIWESYFSDDIKLSLATLGSLGWSFMLVSISYIDLLESRIYHRLVNYIEETK